MNKGLEALEKVKNKEILVDIEMTNTFYNECEDLHNSFDILEKSLKRLEEHDEIFKKYDIKDIWLEPALYVIKNHFPMNTETQLKKLKALDIIKEKEVNVSAFLELDDLKQYNDYCDMVCGCKHLTQEEYDLLKEVLL